MNSGATPSCRYGPTHTANFGVKLQEHCKEIGVPCELMYPAAPDAKHASSKDYLLDKLKTAKNPK